VCVYFLIRRVCVCVCVRVCVCACVRVCVWGYKRDSHTCTSRNKASGQTTSVSRGRESTALQNAATGFKYCRTDTETCVCEITCFSVFLVCFLRPWSQPKPSKFPEGKLGLSSVQGVLLYAKFDRKR